MLATLTARSLHLTEAIASSATGAHRVPSVGLAVTTNPPTDEGDWNQKGKMKMSPF